MHPTSQAAQPPHRLFATLSLRAALIGLALSATSSVRAQTGATPVESVRVPAGGSAVRFKTPLDTGESFLLKATGAVKVGAGLVDAEYGGFGPGAIGHDRMGTADVGVEVGVRAPDALPGVSPGQKHWFGGYRTDHTYYMLVNGGGQALTLRLRGNGGVGSGAITVFLYRLSPTPTSLPRPLESLQVPVMDRTVTTALATRLSAVYLLQASGSGHVGGGGLAQGDAEYMDYNAEGTGQEDIGDAHTDYGLGVDEADQGQSPRLRKWGPWRKDHTYYMLFAGTGRPIHFFFYDVKGGYGDNTPTDTLTVRVFPAP